MKNDTSLLPYPLQYEYLLETHNGQFQRLQRALSSGNGFRLLFAQFNQNGYRDDLVRRLILMYPDSKHFHVDENIENYADFQRQLNKLSSLSRIIHITGLETWQYQKTKDDWLSILNQQRETLAKRCPVTQIWWLSESVLSQLAIQAPDVWAWRAGVFEFEVRAVSPIVPAVPIALNEDEKSKKLQRLDQLNEWLEANFDAIPLLRAELHEEQAILYQALGHYDDARSVLKKALEIYQAEAGTQSEIANVMMLTSDLDKLQGNPELALQFIKITSKHHNVGNF
ncbi:MAG: tetratricopeptide repeat protein [Pseudomonadota bacterium]